jgi:Icc protein
MPDDVVYFVHISDTHFGPTPGYTLYDHSPFTCARRLVEVINNLPTRPHFVIHTGDVVSDPDPRSYQLAAETLANLQAPIYYVNGNHDSVAGIRRYLPMGPKNDLDDHNLLSYAYEVRGYRFLVLDAKGPDEIDPQGRLPDSQLELLATEAQPDGPPLVVFMHFPTLKLNSIWMDTNMLIQNGEALHRLLFPARSRIRAVFYGHVHQPMQTVRDGILYVSGASAFSQFDAWPKATVVHPDIDHDPGYGFVHLLPGQTIVHQHTFPRPEHS